MPRRFGNGSKLLPRPHVARMCLRTEGTLSRGHSGVSNGEALDDSPYVLAWLARALAASGDTTEANRLLEELAGQARVYVDSYYLASVYAALDRKDEAVNRLQRACEERSCWLSRLQVDPIFDSLRLEAGFESVLTNLGLR